MPQTEPSTPPNQTTISTPSAPRQVQPSPAKPGLWHPDDRPDKEGYQDRRQRLERLQESIHLTPAQLRDLLKTIYRYDGACRELIWSDEQLYRYVPRTFESTTVTVDVAGDALEEAIDRSLVRVCWPSAYDVHRFAMREKKGEKNPKWHIFQVIWDGFTPNVPEELKECENLWFQEERRKVFWYPRRD